MEAGQRTVFLVSSGVMIAGAAIGSALFLSGAVGTASPMMMALGPILGAGATSAIAMTAFAILRKRQQFAPADFNGHSRDLLLVAMSFGLIALAATASGGPVFAAALAWIAALPILREEAKGASEVSRPQSTGTP